MKKGIDKSVTAKKLKILLLGLTITFIALGARLFKIMILQSNDLKVKAYSQQINEKKIMPKRGSIYDRNGNKLAVSADVYKVSLDLDTLSKYVVKYKKNSKDIAYNLATSLNMNPEEVEKNLDKKDSKGNPLRSISLARKIEKANVDKLREIIKKESYNFVIIENDTLRYYPNNNFLAHVLGSVDIDGNGLFGIESYYDKELKGIPGMKIGEVDKNSHDLPYYDVVYTDPISGKDLTTTIDEKIQYIIENVAQKAMEENKAKGVTIIAMDPKSGEVLGMVNKPDFNPNEPRKGIKDNDTLQKLWRNKAVNDVFEPGSTFKIVTTAAAIEEKLTNANDGFYCKGYTVVSGVKINCWKPEGHKQETLVDILKNSCNPGFIELGSRLGQEKLNKYIYSFGFGKPTGIDLPGEAAGIIRPADKMTKLDLATISFGQSDAATAVQILSALNAVMNDGIYTTPHIMKEISGKDKDGNKLSVKKYEDKNTRQVISKKTANELSGYLEQVVSKGSGKHAYIEGYGIAGKTGTAEKVNSKTGKYDKGKYVSSFVGAAPYNDPQVSIFVAIDEPSKEDYFGGLVAGPVAKDIFQQIFNYMNIKPNIKN